MLTSVPSECVSGSCKLVAWDIQTGVVIREVDSTLDDLTRQERSLQFTVIACTFLGDDALDAEALCGGQQMADLKGISGQKCGNHTTICQFGRFHQSPLMAIDGHPPPLSTTVTDMEGQVE